MNQRESTSDLLRRVAGAAEERERALADGLVSAPSAVRDIRERLAAYEFAAPRDAAAVLDDLASLLSRWNVHVAHRRYFGLFNPTPLPPAVAAESLAAVVNPQMAVWSHAPAANEIERHALRALAAAIGFDAATPAHFTTGGQESNLTAVAAAFAHAFPEAASRGARALSGDPVLYLSREGHHSLVKAAQVCGLGRDAVRWVPVDGDLRMDAVALAQAIDADRAAGRLPFLVVATAGTTSAGAIDPLPAVAGVCAERGLWLHVDAAWGGSWLLSPRLRGALAGIERAESVAWDAHKAMSVPFAAGMFFCRRREALLAAFDVASSYMPEPRDGCEDLHRVSLQWSRRSMGLKVFAALATLGLCGYAALVERLAAMGEALRSRLAASGWRIVNRTPLPVVCFSHPSIAAGHVTASKVAGRVVKSGRAWISTVKLDGGPPVLRACVTSYRTDESDLDALVAALADALAARDDR